MARDKDLVEAFVDLADTAASDYDVTDLMFRLVEHAVALLEVADAGVLLTDQRGSLQVMAASRERTKLLELFQLQADEGPCLEAYRSGQQVEVPDLRQTTERWPRFTPAALEGGYAAVHAVPLRLREDIIGALNLFSAHPGELTGDGMAVAQALAAAATIGLLHERAAHRREDVIEQLEGALNSRIIIEQAKGVIAERAGVPMDEAFERLRAQARNTNTHLTQVCRDVVEGRSDLVTALTRASTATRPTPPRPRP